MDQQQEGRGNDIFRVLIYALGMFGFIFILVFIIEKVFAQNLIPIFSNLAITNIANTTTQNTILSGYSHILIYERIVPIALFLVLIVYIVWYIFRKQAEQNIYG